MNITIPLITLKRILFSAIVAGALVTAGTSFALAQDNVADDDIEAEVAVKIQFPVAELGGCADKQACKNYCDQEENRRTCFAFAKKHGLMKPQKVQKIEKQIKALEEGGGGPGGCKNENECERYCSDVANMKECVEFGKRHGIMEERELAEAEKILRAVESGAKLPGNCRGKAECELYCSVADHMEECIAFAEQAGFMDKRELEEAKRILPLMKSGQTPGGCRSKGECEAYCEGEGHIEECIAFAEKTGLATPEDLEIMRKTGGRGPGGCRGRVACDTYCGNPEHAEECFKFAEENGLISPEDLEMIKKAGGVELLKKGGPGGCRGKRECEAFCSASENQETCIQFATEKGLVSPEEIEKIKSMGGPQDFQGPGGCRGPRECEEYCSNDEHQEECTRFAPGDRGRDDNQEGGRPPFDEFPGQGEPTEGFMPPPGFGEGAPPHREEGFQVPPGFVPPAGEELTPEMHEKMLRMQEEFKERQQMMREKLQDNIDAKEDEVRRRAEEDLQHRQEFGSDGEEARPFMPPQEGRSLRREMRLPQTFEPREEFTPPAGEFRPPDGFMNPPIDFHPLEGDFRRDNFTAPDNTFQQPQPEFPPQSSAPQSRRALSRALYFALNILLGN